MRKLFLFIPLSAAFVFCSSFNLVATSEEPDPPVLIHRVDPIYPPVAVEKKLEGKVFLELIIDRHGRVIDARIIKSDNSVFNEPCLIAVKKWRYRIDKLERKKTSDFIKILRSSLISLPRKRKIIAWILTLRKQESCGICEGLHLKT